MRFRRVAGLVLVGAALLSALAGCGAAKGGGDVRDIVVAVAPGYYPITYADDEGNAAGYDVDVMKKVDELLPEYNFVFELADKETMNVGVQTGTYQMGINSLFKTKEREEIYLMPENLMGYTPVGFIQRESDDINDFATAVAEGKKVYPLLASSGIRLVVDKYNEEHPEAPVVYDTLSEPNYGTLFASIQDGNYDYAVDLITVFNLQPEENVKGLKVSEPVLVVPTYPIINKDEADLNSKVNDTLKKLEDDGTLADISVKNFGYDLFQVGK